MICEYIGDVMTISERKTLEATNFKQHAYDSKFLLLKTNSEKTSLEIVP